MPYHWNPECLGDIFMLPGTVVDRHLKMAGAVQLKVLLWFSRCGRGAFDAKVCSAAIGQTPADCLDALQYWVEAGLIVAQGQSCGIEPPVLPVAPVLPPETIPAARPRAVKPQMTEVIARQKSNAAFAYLLETVSARFGRPLSPGDMETLLYLFESTGLPAEVILMVVGYAADEDRMNIRYIEKVALDWVDKGILTIAAAEEHLCRLEHRRQAWQRVKHLFAIEKSPTVSELDVAEKWIFQWKLSDDLLRLAYTQCLDKTGKFQHKYMDRILEGWHIDGIDTPEKALAEMHPAKKEPQADSLDLNDYETMVQQHAPVFKKRKKEA